MRFVADVAREQMHDKNPEKPVLFVQRARQQHLLNPGQRGIGRCDSRCATADLRVRDPWLAAAGTILMLLVEEFSCQPSIERAGGQYCSHSQWGD